jgi:hypothetical protein
MIVFGSIANVFVRHGSIWKGVHYDGDTGGGSIWMKELYIPFSVCTGCLAYRILEEFHSETAWTL